MDKQDVLEAAQAIRPHLSDLIGSEAESVAGELDKLIILAEAGEDVQRPIIAILRQRPATSEWVRRLLDTPPTRRSYFEPLPGHHRIPHVSKYVCPLKDQGHDGGDKIWWRFSKEDQIPVCNEHQVLYVSSEWES